MSERTGLAIRRISDRLKEDRGEVNVSMISWMVVAVVVVFAMIGPLQFLLVAALDFVRAQLGI